jgi:hypothetical protein
VTLLSIGRHVNENRYIPNDDPMDSSDRPKRWRGV